MPLGRDADADAGHQKVLDAREALAFDGDALPPGVGHYGPGAAVIGNAVLALDALEQRGDGDR